MDNASKIKKTRIALFTLVFLIVVCLLLQCYKVFFSDARLKTMLASEADEDLYIEINGTAGESDSWKTELKNSDKPGDAAVYMGATCSMKLYNNNQYQVKDWKLRININQDCYLNGFWCGKYEVHQFRNGNETVEVVNAADFDLSSLKLEHNQYTNELMIKLQPGDYLIYLPSEEVSETIIKPDSFVGIGSIFYFNGVMDLTDYEFYYYSDHKFTEGILFKIIIILTIIWVVISVIIFAMIFTFKRTVREIESVNNSIINGLSVEYRTLWLIDTSSRKIKLMRNQDEIYINNAVDLASGFEDCDTAVKYYVDHYVDEEDQERVWEAVQLDHLIASVEDEKFYTVSYLHHSEEEGERYYQMVFVKIHYSGKNNIVLGYRDVDKFERERIEKNKQLEAALLEAEKANKSKSIFLANMSHEIRTPINAILGMDTMILRESTDETVSEYARDIKVASNTLLALINDILDFSKIESGRMEIVPANYRLDSVLNDLINMVKPRAEEKKLKFSFDVNPETPVKLYGDETRVKQIVLNILNNAVKYTNKGEIHFTVGYENITNEETCLKVSVTDTGIGIREEDIEKLFSPYARLDEIKNRGIEGTGLGLTITQSLLEKMGSRLEVSSVYGEGSTFSFVLKQKKWGPEPIGSNLLKTQIDKERPEQYHAKDAQVLVVDDVEMNLIVIKNLLKRICITPDLCRGGDEALELTKNKKYDLILLDAMMPGMSGEDTLKALRNGGGINASTPTVVLTANAIVGAREEYLKAGFDDYLSKPVDGNLLEDMIGKYLPEDKMERTVLSNKKPEQENIKDNSSNSLLYRLGNISGINLSKGIEAAGGKDTYLAVCRNFADTANSRLQQIKGYFEQKDLENYTIQVHALKSSARLVGAEHLSDAAFNMEMAGKENDYERIANNTEALLLEYNTIGEKLLSIFDDSETKGDWPEKELISSKKLNRILNELGELVEAFDFSSAKELFKTLEQYKMPDDFNDCYKALKVSMAEVNNDEIIEIIKKYTN